MNKQLKELRVTMHSPATMEENGSIVTFSDECYYECNSCGYVMPGKQMKLVRYDYGCPRCKNTLTNFTQKKNLWRDDNEKIS